MQVESTRLFRVRAVAEMLDVSVNTVYRAIESGELDALKIGKSLRITGDALNVYLNQCGYAADAVQADVGAVVADGQACVVCQVGFVRSSVSHVPVGHSGTGSQVFACVGDCARQAEQAAAAGAEVAR